MSLDDLPLERTASPYEEAPPPRGPSGARWIVAGLVGLVAGAGLTFWWMSRAQPGAASPAPTTATDVAIGATRPKRQPIDLPPLDQSDAILRTLVSALSRHPTLARFLATPGLVRGATLAVVQIGDGRTPSAPLKVLKPAGEIQIGPGPSGHIDPASYARWDSATSALASVDTAAAAQMYVNVKPLFDQAYGELGHPGGDFDTAIVRAIEMLSDTPTPTDDPLLLKRSGYFEHDDPALRALPPVQKQLLLVGPDNRKKIVAWLKELAVALELKVR